MKRKMNPTTVRIIICAVLVPVVFFGFVCRLFDWQIVHGKEYRELSAASTSYTEVSTATRGEIRAVNGKPLAVNETEYSIIINKIYLGEDNTNEIILTLVALMKECGAKFDDVLPVHVEKDGYAFDNNARGDIEYIESSAMLGKTGLTADELMDGLAERYEAEKIADLEQRRVVISVRYNMEKTGFSYSQAYVFSSDVKSEVVAVVSERTQSIPAVEIRTTNERVIKNGTLIPHILGVVGSLSEEEYEERKDEGYGIDDQIGKFGVEAALEEYLRGKAGEKTVEKDSEGNIISEKETVKAKPGNTVYLTIDPNVQAVANYTLQRNINRARKAGFSAVRTAKETNAEQKDHLGEDCVAGAAVMLDLRDFSVIASASAPNYNIAKYYDPDYSEWLFSTATTPMFNRAFDGVFSPGSSYKPCVALAALQEGFIGEGTQITCTSHYDYYKNDVVNCMHRHGTLTLHSALAQSCNYFFAETGRRTGITTMYLYAEKFGLGVKTGLEVDENTGVLAGRDSKVWYEGNTVQAAIGQSDNTFTPVQLATYVATIANNGVRYRTHLVRKIEDYEKKNVLLYNDPKKPQKEADAGLSKYNLKLVKRAMRAVVTEGTAQTYAGRYPISMGAKTGTAENAGSDHVTFICFAPFEKPEIAVAVVLEHGAKGRFSQFIAMDMMDAYFYGKTVKQVKKNPW